MTREQGGTLLRIARSTIEEALGGEPAPRLDEGWLFQPGATFVTLRRNRMLRGCIGSLERTLPLCEDVQKNALAAAFRDPRFDRLSREELDDTRVEVSVLSALEALAVRTEAEALAALRPGVDGVVLSWGARRGTFIPAMWDQLPEASDFLKYLKQKAGIPQGAWHESIRVHRFTASKWEEE